jgi:hypothetical protein
MMKKTGLALALIRNVTGGVRFAAGIPRLGDD